MVIKKPLPFLYFVSLHECEDISPNSHVVTCVYRKITCKVGLGIKPTDLSP